MRSRDIGFRRCLQPNRSKQSNSLRMSEWRSCLSIQASFVRSPRIFSPVRMKTRPGTDVGPHPIGSARLTRGWHASQDDPPLARSAVPKSGNHNSPGPRQENSNQTGRQSPQKQQSYDHSLYEILNSISTSCRDRLIAARYDENHQMARLRILVLITYHGLHLPSPRTR